MQELTFGEVRHVKMLIPMVEEYQYCGHLTLCPLRMGYRRSWHALVSTSPIHLAQ